MNQAQPPTAMPEAALKPVSAEKSATGVFDTRNVANLWETQTFTLELRWGVRYSQADPMDEIAERFAQRRFSSTFAYAGLNPGRFYDPLGLEDKENCPCECPEKEWGFFGGGAQVALIGGRAEFTGKYTCYSNPDVSVRVDIGCWILGLVAAASIEADFSFKAIGMIAAKGCNVDDLLGKSKALFAGGKIVLGASGNITDGTGTLSVGLSAGVGVANMWCKTTKKPDFFQ